TQERQGKTRYRSAVHNTRADADRRQIGIALFVIAGLDAQQYQIRTFDVARQARRIRAFEREASDGREEDVEAAQLRVTALIAAPLERQRSFGQQVEIARRFLAGRHNFPAAFHPPRAVVLYVRFDLRRERPWPDENYRQIGFKQQLRVGQSERRARSAAGQTAGDLDVLLRPAGHA